MKKGHCPHGNVPVFHPYPNELRRIPVRISQIPKSTLESSVSSHTVYAAKAYRTDLQGCGAMEDSKHNQVDDDLIEQIDDEEMHELVRKAREETFRTSSNQNPGRRMPRWLFWLVSTVFLFSTFSFIFQIYSIPAIEFLTASARLSVDENIQLYKKAVVTVATDESSGTGFSITGDGKILTNFHVIDGKKEVTVAFPDDGIFTAKVVDEYESIDLALLKVDGKKLPYLKLADKPHYYANESVHFIGNPLRFHGIVNEGTIIDSIRLRDWKDKVIMMKAPVYRGNSGSPVFNDEGQVIGVVFATIKHNDYGKIGLFIPINLFLEKDHFSP
jgi:S1-C subfamily serine protease